MSNRSRTAQFSRHGGLAARLAVTVAIFGALITLAISAVDLYRGYQRDLSALTAGLESIVANQRGALERAVWSFDGDQVEAHLAGIAGQPDIAYIAVRIDGENRWTRGTLADVDPIEYKTELRFVIDGVARDIGQLILVADRGRVDARWRNRLVETLIANAVFVLSVAAFFWLLYQFLLGRHLHALGRYVSDLDPGRLPDTPLHFSRTAGGLWRPDELDGISGAINTLVADLRRTRAAEKEASARLAERESYLDAIVTHAGRAIDVLDPDTLKVIDCNETACAALGYTRDEYLALSLSDIQCDFAPEHLVELVNAMAESGGAGFTTRHRHKDGLDLDVDSRVRVVDIGGRRVIVNVWADITAQKSLERELAGARDDLRVITDNIAEALWTTDPDLSIRYANGAASDLVGYSIDEMSTLGVMDLLAPHDADRVRQRVEHLHRMHGVARGEWQLRRKDGSFVPTDVSAQLLPDGRILVLARDMTERLQAEAELRRAASVFASSVEGIIITDGESRILDVNPSFTRITGYTRDEVLGQTPKILQSGRHTDDFYHDMWQALHAVGSWRGEVWDRKKTGEIFPEMLSISSVRGSDGQIREYVAVFSDISPFKAHEEELNRIAHYDALTGLPNRRLLEDRIRQARSRADRERNLLAVCFLDLDGFKPINDQFGHAAGDQLLLAIAGRLEKTLRGGDTLARMGGDEFILLLDDLATPDECLPVLDRVLELVSRPVELEGRSVAVSASIGVTLYPQDRADSDALVRHADQAMYKAKELGKNRVHMFDAENDRRVAMHREQLGELRLALDRGEFELFYQPKVDLRNGAVIGAEALIRWRRSDGRLVSPGEFLPVLHNSPLEVPVSEWVIETALRQSAEWKAADLPSQVSANLVASHLQQRNFVEWLDLLLSRFPTVGRGDFSLEVLESAAIEEVDQAAARLQEIRALGVGLALDDFGTGYSSLAYLRRLPIDTLKVDQGFVRDMLEDKEALGIVESVIQLSAVFKRRAIAEGVETLAHWRHLLELGCDYGQGYGIARPMPAGDFPAWVKRWKQEATWRDALGRREPS